MSPTTSVRLQVNGVEHSIDVEPRLLLVHALRDHLGLTGTHVGCDTSNCGASSGTRGSPPRCAAAWPHSQAPQR